MEGRRCGVVDGGEDGELGRKPRQRRHAEQAEHYDRQADGQPGRAADQPGVVGDPFAADLVSQEGHRGECTQVHEQVDPGVEGHRGDGQPGLPWIAADDGHRGCHRHHHIAGMGDGGVGQQPFDVGLTVGGQVAEGARDGRQKGDQPDDVFPHRLQGHRQLPTPSPSLEIQLASL